MIKKLSLLTLTAGCAMLLWGADFWAAKPYTDWDQKELQTLLTNSPWADRMSIDTGQRGLIGGGGDDTKNAIQGNIQIPVTAIWRTALPIKQAFAKFNGNADSAETKASFERPETSYVLQLIGLPGSARTAAADKDKLIAETSLKVKGKPDLKPTEFELVAGPAPAAPPADAAGAKGKGGGKGGFGAGKGGAGGGTVDLLFLFPRSTTYTADDKELEFVTKVGTMVIRKKFKLKDMMFNGKLEM